MPRLRLPSERALAIALAHTGSAALLLQLAIFYGFVLRARCALGRWPEPYRPDPKDLDFTVHWILAVLGPLMAMLTPFLVIVCLSAAKTLGLPRKHLRAAAIVFSVCYLGSIYLSFADPGRFREWLMD